MKHLFLLAFLLVSVRPVSAQQNSDYSNQSNPRTAFLKSLAVPGWGHYYVNRDDWPRGKYHLGADVLLIISFLGFNIHSNNLQQDWYSYARSEAGINIEDRSRTIRLAVGDFNNLSAYNDYQLRTRNWGQLIEDKPENRWNWQSDELRSTYNDIRNRFENIDQQLPALVGLMVVNRVISAISAYNRAGKTSASETGSAFYFTGHHSGSGVIANLKVHF
ncbi:MAG: hypothetical protein ACNS64_10050 [Candidatus Halalkalibacterium sp. M3_1C_030]